jgi:hypothetical protein
MAISIKLGTLAEGSQADDYEWSKCRFTSCQDKCILIKSELKRRINADPRE